MAATGDSATGTTATGNTNTSAEASANALLLSGVTVDDDMHIRMDFTQNIVIESVRLRIAKQSDGTNIKIESLTGVLDAPMSVYVNLSDLLQAWESYTMTVISALSDKWVAITEWTDALSEFTAPNPLKQALVVFNAPSNPTAVTTETVEETPVVEETVETAATTTTATGWETPPIPENSELPLTGMNPMILVILSCIFAFALIMRRKA